MSDQELEHLVNEIEEYQKKMAQVEKQMKSSSSAFMTAHAATMEVLGVAGIVQYHERFSHKGSRDVRCMLCMMVFNSHEVWKRHIISCYWTLFEATLSISHKCCKFLYGNVIATAYACASICGFFTYENMSLSGRCHIVLFVYCRGRNKQFTGNMAVSKKKMRMTSWLQINEKGKQM